MIDTVHKLLLHLLVTASLVAARVWAVNALGTLEFNSITAFIHLTSIIIFGVWLVAWTLRMLMSAFKASTR